MLHGTEYLHCYFFWMWPMFTLHVGKHSGYLGKPGNCNSNLAHPISAKQCYSRISQKDVTGTAKNTTAAEIILKAQLSNEKSWLSKV